MRKIFLISALISLGAIIFFACNKKDTFPPRIFLYGGDTTVYLGSLYVDPGATCEDNMDGNLNSSLVIGHNIPKNPDSTLKQTGTYFVYFTATDKAGNQTSLQRKVIVKNSAYMFESEYKMSRTKLSGAVGDSIGREYGDNLFLKPLKAKVKADTKVNRRLQFTEIGGGGVAGLKIRANVDLMPNGQFFKIEPQYYLSKDPVTQDSVKYFIKGYDTIGSCNVMQLEPFVKFKIKYFLTKYNSTTATVPSISNIIYEETYIEE